ncbi:dual specificity protein phosphatase 3 [Elysia marginata]|uniref:protein-serine/threonine phosphatase n=1 Tax=Elysia marginata TaxID=1093978 RepID=A0AAV4FUG9_9GAST|nr:dual specificity protein phosphatase 3 [Elysia marginata]
MASYFDDDRPCTIEELEGIITAPSGGLTMLPSSPYDEICEGIYIGEGDSACSINRMKGLGITHVLNAALGKDAFHVNTNHVMYRKAGIHFLGIEATDFINYNMTKHFEKAVDFIESAVEAAGKVFVHCVQGVSRSATLVLAFLMIKRHMTVQDAMRMVRSKREVCPNPGFLQQLCQLDERLKKEGHYVTLGEKSLSKNSESQECLEKESASLIRFYECTVQEIEQILKEPAGGIFVMPDSVYSQIDRHIFIGEGEFALDTENLRRLQVTHVLNSAQCRGINSNPNMYTNSGFHFFAVMALDRIDCDISQFFNTAADFIESAVKSNGKVYVHCVKGVSRSPTLVMAYYMIKCNMTLPDAARLVRAHREIIPNIGFLRQLCQLNNNLAREGHFSSAS